MKKYTLAVLILCSFMVFTGSAWSLTVNAGATDVGGLDTLIAATTLANSGDATELAFVNSVLGTDFGFIGAKTDTSGGAGWLQTNQVGTFAFEFITDEPSFFLIKTGKTNGPDRDFLFQNNANLDWAVIALSDLEITSVTNVGKISHIDEFGGGNKVPEPGMLMLFGTGLLGLGIFGRKKFGK
jgi:hypothetical protein